MKKELAELKKRPFQFDLIGLGLLAVCLSAWEILLSKGQQWDWLGDPFWRVQTLVVLFVGGLVLLLIREMRIAYPVVDFRPLAERNLALSCIIIFCAYGVLYAASTTLPGLLQSLFGYDAYCSGLVMSPSGLGSISMLLLVGVLIGRGIDARWMIAAGLLVAAAGNYWMSLTNLDISPWQVVWPRVVLAMGMGLLFRRSTWPPTSTRPAICAAPPWACSACCGTKGAASAPRWLRRCTSGATNSTRSGWAR